MQTYYSGYNGPLPTPSPYTMHNGVPVPNRIMWGNDSHMPMQVIRPTIPNGNINDRTEDAPYRTEYNPYFWDNYKYRNMY